MRGRADPGEMTVRLEGLKRRGSASCKGGNQDEIDKCYSRNRGDSTGGAPVFDAQERR